MNVLVLEVLPIVLYIEVKPFLIWFYLPLLDNDVSLHDLVELLIASSMSQRSSKTESERKSYECFRSASSASTGTTG